MLGFSLTSASTKWPPRSLARDGQPQRHRDRGVGPIRMSPDASPVTSLGAPDGYEGAGRASHSRTGSWEDQARLKEHLGEVAPVELVTQPEGNTSSTELAGYRG